MNIHTPSGSFRTMCCVALAFCWTVVYANPPATIMSAPGTNTGAAGARSAATVARGSPLPDLTFSFVSVEKRTYSVAGGAKSIMVLYFPSSSPSDKGRQNSECERPDSFPLQLIVKNIGQADFAPKDSFQVVGVNIGPWNSAKDLVKLRKGESQIMDFNVTLPPGRYTLQALIDLHNAVAESRSDNNILSWPLEVKCDTRAMAPAPIPAPAFNGGFGSKRPVNGQ